MDEVKLLALIKSTLSHVNREMNHQGNTLDQCRILARRLKDAKKELQEPEKDKPLPDLEGRL